MISRILKIIVTLSLIYFVYIGVRYILIPHYYLYSLNNQVQEILKKGDKVLKDEETSCSTIYKESPISAAEFQQAPFYPSLESKKENINLDWIKNKFSICKFKIAIAENILETFKSKRYGECPCPYNTNSANVLCGENSDFALAKIPTDRPQCYPIQWGKAPGASEMPRL